LLNINQSFERNFEGAFVFCVEKKREIFFELLLQQTSSSSSSSVALKPLQHVGSFEVWKNAPKSFTSVSLEIKIFSCYNELVLNVSRI